MKSGQKRSRTEGRATPPLSGTSRRMRSRHGSNDATNKRAQDPRNWDPPQTSTGGAPRCDSAEGLEKDLGGPSGDHECTKGLWQV